MKKTEDNHPALTPKRTISQLLKAEGYTPSEVIPEIVETMAAIADIIFDQHPEEPLFSRSVTTSTRKLLITVTYEPL